MKNKKNNNDIDIDWIEDPQVLKNLLKDLFSRFNRLEQALVLSDTSEKININNKIDRLNQIKHWISELTERMKRPYIMPAALSVVVDTLETLWNAGDCNSLIIEGMPGTGKTQLAYSQVWEKLREWMDISLIHLRVKDSMKASELLYSIDDVRRLNDAETKISLPEHIRTEAEERKEKVINWKVKFDDKNYLAFKEKLDAVKDLSEAWKDLNYINYVDFGELWEAIYQSQFKQVYLIIDEIEKWDEALMTGILDEIENLEFTIRETGQKIKWKKQNLKIIITTNTEDSDKIPPSFRRRSLYHFQNYPDREEMAEIVNSYYGKLSKSLLEYALDVFYSYHENDEIEKKPSTPELLSWLLILMKEYPDKLPADVPHKHILLKYKQDQDLAIAIHWFSEVISSVSQEVPHYVRKALEGNQVYYLSSEFNKYNYYDNGKLAKLYAKLENEWISYSIPEFENQEIYYDDGTSRANRACTQKFHVVAQWVQNIGEGIYILDNEVVKNILEPMIKSKTIIMDNLKFQSVESRNNNYTLGQVEVGWKTYKAYNVKDSDKFVVVVDYKLDLDELT